MSHCVKLTILASAVLAVASQMAIAEPAKNKMLTKKSKNQVELLYFQYAKKAHVSTHARDKNCYTMTLSGLSSSVGYFANFPLHVSGRMSLDKFNTTWQHAEKTDGMKPNAVLHAYQSKNISDPHSTVNMVVELSGLKYNPNAKTMSYTACPLNKEERLAASSETTQVTLYEVNLFIDPIKPWPP